MATWDIPPFRKKHRHQRCLGILPAGYFPGKNDVIGAGQLCDPLGTGPPGWRGNRNCPPVCCETWQGKSPMNNGNMRDNVGKDGKSSAKWEVFMRTWSRNDGCFAACGIPLASGFPHILGYVDISPNASWIVWGMIPIRVLLQTLIQLAVWTCTDGSPPEITKVDRVL